MQEKISRDVRHYAWLMIGRSRHLMMKARQKELNPYEISPQQATVLDVMYNLGHKTTLAELAKESERGVSVLSARLTRMERDGLVKKSRENRKSVLKKFELTEKGVIAYKNSMKIESIEKIMSVLSDEEIHQLILFMKKLASAAENY